MESIYFDEKFLLKYIDRPRRLWSSYSSHSVWSTPSHSAWSVCRSVTAVSPSITAQPIDMPFGLRTWVGPRNHVLLFSVSVFAYHCTAWVSSCVKTLKTESIYLDGKLLSKYINQPCRVWSSYSSHFGVINSFTVRKNFKTVSFRFEPYLLLPTAASKSTWTPIRT